MVSMPTRRTKSISSDRFAKRFANIVEKSLAKLPAHEQDARITAFEEAVSKISRGTPARVSRTPRTPAIPLVARGRE